MPTIAALVIFFQRVFGNTWHGLLAQLGLLMAILATASIPIVTFIAKEWDDAASAAAEVSAVETRAERDYWRNRTTFFVRLNSVINELVLDKSAGYIDVAARALVDRTDALETLGQRDNLDANVTRIITLLYRFLEAYADIPSGRRFQVTFFAVDPPNRQLVLINYFNADQQPPRSILVGASNEHLAKDGDSLASLAWRLQTMIVIPNTVEELRQRQPRFVSFYHGEEAEIRSIVAYPVVDRQLADLGYDPCVGVLCAACGQEGIFLPEDRDLRFLFDTFAARLVFETRRGVCHSLTTEHT